MSETLLYFDTNNMMLTRIRREIMTQRSSSENVVKQRITGKLMQVNSKRLQLKKWWLISAVCLLFRVA